jgi:hypothetical protein
MNLCATGRRENKQLPLLMQVPWRKAWLVQLVSTQEKHAPTHNQTSRTPGKTQVHSPRCSEYCKEKLVCDDAELAVNDTFRDVRQCSNAGSGFDRVGCLPFTKERRKYRLASATGTRTGFDGVHGGTSTSTSTQSVKRRSASRPSCAQSMLSTSTSSSTLMYSAAAGGVLDIYNHKDLGGKPKLCQLALKFSL